MTDLLCAVCVEEPAEVPDLIDGRAYLVCRTCRGDGIEEIDVAAKDDRRSKILEMVDRNQGCTAAEVADRFDALTRSQRTVVHQMLGYLVRGGWLRCDDRWGRRRFWRTGVEYDAEAARARSSRFSGVRQPSKDGDLRVKLTEVHVTAIRDLRRAGHSLALIAARFNVSRGTVSRICSGKRWTHVPDETEVLSG